MVEIATAVEDKFGVASPTTSSATSRPSATHQLHREEPGLTRPDASTVRHARRTPEHARRRRHRARCHHAPGWRRRQHLGGAAGRTVGGQRDHRRLGQGLPGAARRPAGHRPGRADRPRPGPAAGPQPAGRRSSPPRRRGGLRRRRRRGRPAADRRRHRHRHRRRADPPRPGRRPRGARAQAGLPFTIPMLMPNGPAAAVGLASAPRPGCTRRSAPARPAPRRSAGAWTCCASDRADVVVVGGTEACVHPLPMAGFAAMRRHEHPQRRARARVPPVRQGPRRLRAGRGRRRARARAR